MTNNYTILVIEDNLEMAENICSIVKLANYNVLHAANGKTGVALAKQQKPDLILCDIMMPELDGYAVLHILNKDAELANIPFIFLTAKIDLHDLRDGMNLGADDYITKPFQGLDLLKVIEIRLEKVRLLKATVAKSQNHTQRPEGAGTQNGSCGLEKITDNRNVRLFRKKDLIFMEGQSAFDLYFIISGRIKTYKVNYEGKELITGFYHEGDFLGYIPLLEDRCHHESAEVMEDAQISIVPKHEFLDIIYSNNNIAKKFLKMLSVNLIETESRLLDVAYQSVRQRVAGALLKINTQGLAAKSVITTTRRDISNTIGTTSESLNRTLADFKEEGIIEIRDEGILIIDKNKLERNCKQPTFSTVKLSAKG
jgi:CRP-like cAMP-binding protein/CheY-like chemotaxis protein